MGETWFTIPPASGHLRSPKSSETSQPGFFSPSSSKSRLGNKSPFYFATLRSPSWSESLQSSGRSRAATRRPPVKVSFRKRSLRKVLFLQPRRQRFANTEKDQIQTTRRICSKFCPLVLGCSVADHPIRTVQEVAPPCHTVWRWGGRRRRWWEAGKKCNLRMPGLFFFQR